MKQKKSILEMARGAFLERADYEMAKVIENILDPNTKASAKRKLTITMDFSPDDDRQNIMVGFQVKSTLAPTNPARTTLFIAGEDSTGEAQVVEMAPQIPGQQDMDGGEQESAPLLRLVM